MAIPSLTTHILPQGHETVTFGVARDRVWERFMNQPEDLRKCYLEAGNVIGEEI